MNKKELIDTIANKSCVTKQDTAKVIDTLLDVVMHTVASGDKVTLIGFGVLEKRDRAERKGHNPSTGEPIMIAATTVPAFSPGKTFKELVNR